MKLQRPVIASVGGLKEISLASLAHEARFESALLQAVDASGIVASNMSFDEAKLEKIILVGAKLEKIRLSDVISRGCDLSGSGFSEGSFIRTVFRDCRFTGADFSGCVLKDVVFDNCKLDMANFRKARLDRTQFTGCQLHEADFQMAELNKIEFQDCELERVEFAQCRLHKADARSSRLFDIRGWRSLRGLTIDSAQLMTIAPELANELGLEVRE